jgi:hypothetical protein
MQLTISDNYTPNDLLHDIRNHLGLPDEYFIYFDCFRKEVALDAKLG